jgi:hypothetical protein
MKSQIVVDKKSQEVICTDFVNGKCHDFALYKKSKVHAANETEILADSGYQGLSRLHANTRTPKKASKKIKLSKVEKQSNRQLSSQRVLNENVIGKLKRFKIISDRYRNRRKRFGLRFNLIAGIYNSELMC